jgi:4-hydroxybenzoate polyprenyltransferase
VIPYLQLVRLPNVFTAMADILLGYLFTHASLAAWPTLALLMAASSALYMAGMVLNDLFDVEIDRAERPGRPLPSGRVGTATARRLGILLIVIGLGAGWGASWLVAGWRPGIVATLLALLIVAYDAVLRRTPVGPLAMGGCRGLNVLLGMSAAAYDWQAVNYVIAGGLGIYIAGVTWFSRSEAQTSRRGALSFSTLVMLGGIAVVAAYPRFVGEQLPAVSQPLAGISLDRWRLLMFAIGGLVAWRALHAIVRPEARQVQLAVKSFLMTLIVLNAAVCITVRGWPGAIAILALLIPTMLLGRWIYST